MTRELQPTVHTRCTANHATLLSVFWWKLRMWNIHHSAHGKGRPHQDGQMQHAEGAHPRCSWQHMQATGAGKRRVPLILHGLQPLDGFFHLAALRACIDDACVGLVARGYPLVLHRLQPLYGLCNLTTFGARRDHTVVRFDVGFNPLILHCLQPLDGLFNLPAVGARFDDRIIRFAVGFNSLVLHCLQPSYSLFDLHMGKRREKAKKGRLSIQAHPLPPRWAIQRGCCETTGVHCDAIVDKQQAHDEGHTHTHTHTHTCSTAICNTAVNDEVPVRHVRTR